MRLRPLALLLILPLACTDDGSDGGDEASSSSTTADTGSADESGTSTDTGTTDGTDTSSTDTSTTTDTGTDATDTGGVTCESIEAAYFAAVAVDQCMDAGECKIIDGHCGVGLGGCYYAVNQSVDEAALDALAQMYSDLGCTSGVCDCAEPPATLECSAEGHCMGI